MKTHFLITAGLVFGLSSGLRADFEAPGPGPDLDVMTGDSDRAWNFWVRTFVGYNDNVQLVPDAGVIPADQESGYFGLSAQGSYDFFSQGNFSAGAALRLDQTYHFDSSGGATAANNFDLTVVEPALYLNYRNDDWFARVTYSYRWEDADTTAIGLSSHNLGVKVGTELNDCLHAEFAWTHGWDDYDTPGVGVAERNGERDRISFSLIRPADSYAPRMILRYSYLNNDADGSNFRYDGHELMFRVEMPLTEKIAVAAQVSYAELDYSTGVRSEQDVLGAQLQVVYQIDDNWSADFYYSYLDLDSDATFFRGARNNVGMGLRYNF